MSGKSLELRRWDGGYAVFDGMIRVSDVIQHRSIALEALDRLQEKARLAKRSRERSCLTCGHRFWSTGPGHRMCNDCRGRASGIDAQMLG